MNSGILFFFEGHPGALELYEAFEQRVRAQVEGVTVKVGRSQISFYNRHMFACVSFARVRRKRDCPPCYLVVTFGLDHRVESARIDVATQPYPNRWTHHVLISDKAQIDGELMGWITQAAAFAAAKR